MGVYVGSGGSPAGFVLESVYGTWVTPTIALDLVTESIMENTEPLRSPAVFGSRAYNTYHQGSKSAAGDFRIICQPDSLPTLLYALTGGTEATTQVLATTAYDHDFVPADAGGDLPSISLEIDKHGTVCRYPGTVIDTMTIEWVQGAYVEATFNVLCERETDDQVSTGLSLSARAPYIGDFCSLEVDTSAVTYAIGGSIQIQNFIDVDASHRMDGTRYRAQPRMQNFMISGSLDMEWSSDSDAIRDAIKHNTSVQLTFVCTSEEEIESGYYYTLTIDVPVCKLIGDLPTISTRDRIPFTVNFEGIYDSTNLIKITHRDARTTDWSA